MKKKFLFLFFAILLTSCNSFGNTLTSTPIPTETPSPIPTTFLPPTSRKVEEANVYSVLLNEDPQGYIGNSSVVIILDETLTYMASFSDSDNNSILEDLPALEKETLIDFREINQREQILKLDLLLKKPYEIISTEELNKREQEDLHYYDGGTGHTITMFSGIGFNITFTQAFVYVEHYCGGECAKGDWYFLIRDENGWKIESIMDGWIS